MPRAIPGGFGLFMPDAEFHNNNNRALQSGVGPTGSDDRMKRANVLAPTPAPTGGTPKPEIAGSFRTILWVLLLAFALVAFSAYAKQ
jgi:hypothetical protein